MSKATLKSIQGNNGKLFFILGPCVIESEKHAMHMAEQLKKLSEKLAFTFVFKSSFDKANRTALKNYRGPGIDEGGKILDKIRNTFGIPVTTDIHESWQAEIVAPHVDVIQLPALLCRQTDLLVAAGKTDAIVNIKKAQFVAPETMGTAIEKVESGGTKDIWVTERGYMFGYSNLVVDYRNFPIMKRFGKPVIFDATHSVQRPSSQGCSSGGNREYASTLARAAVVQGIAGIFMEVHDNPEDALCDGPNSIRLSQLESFLQNLLDLDAWAKAHPESELS